MKQHITDFAISQAQGPACVKQSVYALLVCLDGQRFVGSNEMKAEGITVCPRVELNYATGEGYHHCIETCKQELHAEKEAIKRAKEAGAEIAGSTLHLVGHYYCCDNCTEAMIEAGVERVIYVEDDNREEILPTK